MAADIEAAPQAADTKLAPDEVEVIVCSGLYQADPSIRQPSYVTTLGGLAERDMLRLPNRVLAEAGLLPEAIVGVRGTIGGVGMDEVLSAREAVIHEKAVKASSDMTAEFIAARREKFQQNHPILGRLALLASQVRVSLFGSREELIDETTAVAELEESEKVSVLR